MLRSSLGAGSVPGSEPTQQPFSRDAGGRSMAKLNINGSPRDVEVEADTPLLWVIREQVGLTGTKYGCGVAQCGACGVKPTDQIVTIEGLSGDSSHPVQ